MDSLSYEMFCGSMLMGGVGDERDRLLNSALGLAGETGELVDLVKKHTYHDHPLDTARVLLEAGDVLFYLTALVDQLGYGLDEVAEMNMDKLKARYPDGWDAERSKDH